jgi:hypothetical protein
VAIHADHQRDEASPARRAAIARRLVVGEAAAVSPDRAAVLELQRQAGNRAVVAALGLAAVGPAKGVLQRISWDDVIDVAQWTNPLTIGQKALRTVTGVELNAWAAAEQAVRASASRIAIPATYYVTAGRYAAANPDDGAILRDAINEEPKHYHGGWLLKANEGAEAITFGNSVFYDRSAPTEETFVHELVHINQYRKLGRAAFVASYFGASLATIIKRAIAGQPIEADRSSPHEEAAYRLEARFKDWRKNNPG